MGGNIACDWVNNHDDLIEKLRAWDHVMVLFYASWCPFCVRFLPLFEKHAGQGGRHFVLVQDDDETIADHYSVTIYPTVLFFEKGVISRRLDGAAGVGLDEKQWVEFVRL